VANCLPERFTAITAESRRDITFQRLILPRLPLTPATDLTVRPCFLPRWVLQGHRRDQTTFSGCFPNPETSSSNPAKPFPFQVPPNDLAGNRYKTSHGVQTAAALSPVSNVKNFSRCLRRLALALNRISSCCRAPPWPHCLRTVNLCGVPPHRAKYLRARS